MHPVRAFAIAAAGILLGLAWNARSGRGIALTANAFILPGEDVVEIPAAAARTRLDQGALFLDARPADFYSMSHIPGALSLPEDDFDRAFLALEPTLRTRFEIVVYCSGFGCEASHIVARKLRERGVPAAVLHDGIPAWEDARYPLRKGPLP